MVTTAVPASLGSGAGGAVTGATTLYLHGGDTGVGNVDAAGNGSTMDTSAPSDDQPAVYHSSDYLTNDEIVDAVWTWTPEDGYDFSNVNVTVQLWIASPGSPLNCGGYGVALSNAAGTIVERPPGDGLDPDHRGGVSLYTVTFNEVTAAGDELSLEVTPHWDDCDDVNAIVYDAQSFQSRVEIRPFGTEPAPVSGDATLFFHSESSKVGNADWLTADSSMTEDEPTDETPSVWHSVNNADRPVSDPESPADAYWTYRPEGGFAFEDKTVVVEFWGGAADYANVLGHSWNVQLYVDGSLVADSGQQDFPAPATPGAPSQFEVTFVNQDLTGDELVVQIHPFYSDSDTANYILYDSPAYPSNVQIGAGSDEQAPTAPADLTADQVGSTTIDLSWTPASDNYGVDHYNVFRNDTNGDLVEIGQSETASFSDEGLQPSTTYEYAVSAEDAAGNVGPRSDTLDVTTSGPDATPPAITVTTEDVSATGATIAWTTDEDATSTLEVDGRTFTSDLGTQHRVHVPSLAPDTSYTVQIDATDLSSNTGSTSYTLETGTTQIQWLHNEADGDVYVETISEFNTTTDADGRGWNSLGGLLNMYTAHTGQGLPVFGAIEDVYPTGEPLSPTVNLDESQPIEATIYVDFEVDASVNPALDGVAETESAPGAALLNLSLYANGDELVGAQTVEQTIAPDRDFVPVEFSFPALVGQVEQGTLRAELHAEATTHGYGIGYEDDHASNVRIPVEQTLPLSVSISAEDGQLVEDAPAAFSANVVGGQGSATVTWDFGDGGTAQGTDVTHTYAKPGTYTVEATATDGASTETETLEVQVRQTDFVNNARTVVAVIDTGVNPYHPVYQRSGATMPAFENHTDDGTFAPRTVDLADQGTYQERVDADEDTWNSIDTGELVWFEDTNVLGVSFHDPTESGAIGNDRIRDHDGHGTATSSTVLANAPDTVVVMIQPTIVESAAGTALLGADQAIGWAVDQPWIDVISLSAGALANAPLGGITTPELTQEAYESGKVVVMSAGNDPSPTPTDSNDGPPWVWSVTGSQADGQGHAAMSSNVYPDYTAPYTVQAAQPQTTGDAYGSISGTSFSAPTVSGTVAGIVHELRASEGHTSGIENGEIAPGYTNRDVRDALNKTALLPAWDGTIAGTTGLGYHANPPGAPWLTAQWGFVDERVIPNAVTALQDDELEPSNKLAAAAYKQATYQTRVQYWETQMSPPRDRVAGFASGESVPGPRVNVQPLDDPVVSQHPYQPNADETWEIQVDGANLVSLHFEDFVVETGFDFVQVEDPAGTVYGTYSQTSGADFWSAPVPGDTVIVHLVSDGSLQRHGFEVHEVDVLG